MLLVRVRSYSQLTGTRKRSAASLTVSHVMAVRRESRLSLNGGCSWMTLEPLRQRSTTRANELPFRERAPSRLPRGAKVHPISESRELAIEEDAQR